MDHKIGSMFRLNFGQGQVSRTFDTYSAALREARETCSEDQHTRIQRYAGDGEWTTYGVPDHGRWE